MSKLNTMYYDYDLRKLPTSEVLFEGECCIRLLARYGMAEEFDIPVPPPPYERIKSRYREVQKEIYRRELAALSQGFWVGFTPALILGAYLLLRLYLVG